MSLPLQQMGKKTQEITPRRIRVTTGPISSDESQDEHAGDIDADISNSPEEEKPEDKEAGIFVGDANDSDSDEDDFTFLQDEVAIIDQHGPESSLLMTCRQINGEAQAAFNGAVQLFLGRKYH